MATDVTRTPSVGHRGTALRRPPAGPAPERAQLVWRRARELADSPAHDDRFRLALDLLRAAHHDPATMAHALSLGRTHLRSHPADVLAHGAARILEGTIAFLGIKPGPGDIDRARR